MSNPSYTDLPLPGRAPSPILVRLSCEMQSALETQLEGVLDSFRRLGTAVLGTETLGARAITFLQINVPRPGEIADFILQLGRLGDVAVVTQAELGENESLLAQLRRAAIDVGRFPPDAQTAS